MRSRWQAAAVQCDGRQIPLEREPQWKAGQKVLELAIILRDLPVTHSMVRWVPHQKMLADSVTKMDPLHANDALNQFLKSGWLSLVDVAEEVQNRQQDPTFKRRSHKASHDRLLGEYANQCSLFVQVLQDRLINEIWGDCQETPKESVVAVDQSVTS